MSDNLPTTPTERLLDALDPRGDVDRGLAVTIAHDLAGDAATVLAELVGKTVARARADALRDRGQVATGGHVPIRLSVRLLDDDGAPWPGKTNVQFASEAGQQHRLSIAPDAGDVDLGAALRQVIARELALRDRG